MKPFHQVSNTGRNNRRTVMALDLGGTKLASALYSVDGQSMARRHTPLDARQDVAVGALIAVEVKRLAAAAVRRKMPVQCIGISVPGIADRKTGRVWAPNIPGWDDFPLRDVIIEAIGDTKIKVKVDNDRTASILGEAWQGAVRGCRNAIFLAVGTGIGAGILVDGQVLEGAQGIAGAIGWLALDRPFRPDYVARGCFESHASGHGIATIAKAMLGRRKNYRGLLRRKRTLTSHDVFTAYEQGDEIADLALRQAIAYWGMAAANLVSLFNPEKVIFGGGVFGPARQFLDAIAQEARRWAQPIAMREVQFESSQLGEHAALYGAGYLAWNGRRLSNRSRGSERR